MKRIISATIAMMLVIATFLSGCVDQVNINDDLDQNIISDSVDVGTKNNDTLIDESVSLSETKKTDTQDAYINVSAVKSYETFKKYSQQIDETINTIRNVIPVGRTSDIPLDRLMDTRRVLEYYSARYYHDPNYKPAYGKIYFTDTFNWGSKSIFISVDYMAPNAYDDIDSRVFLDVDGSINLSSGKGIVSGGWNIVPYYYNEDMFDTNDIGFLTSAYSNGYVYVKFNDCTSSFYKDGKLIRLFFMYKNTMITVYAPDDTVGIPDVKDSVNGFVADLMNLETMSSVMAKFDAAMKAEYGTAN